MRGRPSKDPHTRPAINTLERFHAEPGGQILENKAEAQRLATQMIHVKKLAPVPASSKTTGNVTVTNSAQPGLPSHYETNFMISVELDEGGVTT